jgi:hypothetical protein
MVYIELLMWVKCLRIFKGFFIFNVSKLRDQIQKWILVRNYERAKHDYDFSEDILSDHAYIG